MKGSALGLGVALSALLNVGCTAARPLTPLGRGRVAAEVSALAAWTRSEAFATPLGGGTVGARVGLSPRWDVRARLHPLLLPLGLLGLESGAVWHGRGADGLLPGVSVSGDVSGFAHLPSLGKGPAQALRGAGELAVALHWQVRPEILPYVVSSHALVFAEQTPVFSALIGVQLRPSARWQVSLETGLADYTHASRAYTQPWLGIGGRGAIWASWGVSYLFDFTEKSVP